MSLVASQQADDGQRVDREELTRGLCLFHSEGDVFEIRVLDAAGAMVEGRRIWRSDAVAYGFFDSVSRAVDEIDNAIGGSRAVGIYTTLNPVPSELLARAANRFREATKRDMTTKDRSVPRLMRLLMDFDRDGEKGISASEEEKRITREVAEKVRHFLRSQDWPEPVLIDSGNGWHLVYAIDLTAEDSALVAKVLQALAKRFDVSGQVSLDVSVHNPSRITKVPGTWARKGDNTSDRPHRMARIIDEPETFGEYPVSREKLEALAAEVVIDTKATSAAKDPDRGHGFLETWLSEHAPGAKKREARDDRDREVWDLNPCSCHPNHGGTGAIVTRERGGRLGYNCFHETCASCTWMTLRDKFRAATGAEPSGQGEALPRPDHANRWIGTYDVPGILERSGASGPRYRVGIESIDERLTLATQPERVGLPLGRILGIEGPPHSGKSLMICQATLALVLQGLRVLFLVVDEPREDAAERIGQGLGFRHAELNREHPDTIQGVRTALIDFDLQLLPDDENDERPPTIEETAEILFSVKNEKGYGLSVDSINKARSMTERDADSNRERIEKRMSAFRRLRRENGKRLSILFTAEANRASYASRDETQHVAAMASGAESRDLEFVSDVLLVLKVKKDDDLVRVEIPKNRVGRKYEPLSLRRHDGSASLRPVSEEAVEMEAEGREAEKDFADRNALLDKIVSFVTEKTEPMSKRAIERSFSKSLAKKFGGRQAIRDAIDFATEDLTPPRLEKVKATGRKGGGGFVYRIPRPETQAPLTLADTPAKLREDRT